MRQALQLGINSVKILPGGQKGRGARRAWGAAPAQNPALPWVRSPNASPRTGRQNSAGVRKGERGQPRQACAAAAFAFTRAFAPRYMPAVMQARTDHGWADAPASAIGLSGLSGVVQYVARST